MQPRSALGRQVVAETQGRIYTEPTTKKTKIIKRKKDERIGVRLAQHPTSKQVVLSQLYNGYPAIETGRLFVGDVLLAVNDVKVTQVDMALQLIKMHTVVELTTTDVYNHTDGSPRPVQRPTERIAGGHTAQVPGPTQSMVGDLLGGTEDESPTSTQPTVAVGDLLGADFSCAVPSWANSCSSDSARSIEHDDSMHPSRAASTAGRH